METLKISLDERYMKEARKLGIVGDVSAFFNNLLKDFVESKKAELEKARILEGLQEAVDDVNNNRVSRVDSLWESMDD